jgi:hypothetical protein
MQTLFECWNGGQTIIQNNQPWFVFQFPANSPEVLSFFQLSARVCETMAGMDCYLNMGGQAFDVPNFPLEEVNYTVANVQQTMGYAPYIVPIVAPSNFGGGIPVKVVVWVNLGTGRADMYNPFAGYVYGPQLMVPKNQQFQPAFYNQFNMSMQTNGAVQGTGQKSTLAKLAGIMKDMNAVFGEAGKMYDFFDQRFDFGGGNDYSGDWSGGGGW